MLNFRTLNANEIECRISMVKANGLSLLLYKDARVDQNILDEAVGPMNWQRHHSRDNANCIVSIWDPEKSQWIEKEDTGKESNAEREKGLASDSFKRACFNWGIGRELYTAPFIWITQTNANIREVLKGKYQCYDKFEVDSIEYDVSKNIVGLTIKNTSTGRIVYTFGKQSRPADPKPTEPKPEPPKWKVLEQMAKRDGINILKLCKLYKVSSLEQFTDKFVENAVKNWSQIREMCK